ncbi:MAG: hypothetical protein IT338_16355 [Thermomicrobiales bacterium]|nr:hypothetical protein [Thermomicrobiales bacterium]
MSDAASPPLETGWFPTTPVDDTYLRRYLLNWAGFCAASARSLGGDSRDLPEASLADASDSRPSPTASRFYNRLHPNAST